ncbi:MAG: LysM peptidoglycan-binding domain-containing protein [Patescibacteria group bacterium]|nr:LysM peptidoglycan-binding domain-containing protein [Patescibacteria group bacterium]
MTYREKLKVLLKNQGSQFSIGVFTLLVIIIGAYLIADTRNLQVTEIDSDKRDAFLNPSPVTERRYTVQEGEGLWQIAEKTTGSGFNWVQIAEANNIVNPDTIAPGMVLIIPSVGTMAPTASPAPALDTGGQIDGGMTGRARPDVSEYTVQEGEGLWQIAEKIYGDGNVWVHIAKENGLTDPNAVYPGMKLTMPGIR